MCFGGQKKLLEVNQGGNPGGNSRTKGLEKWVAGVGKTVEHSTNSTGVKKIGQRVRKKQQGAEQICWGPTSKIVLVIIKAPILVRALHLPRWLGFESCSLAMQAEAQLKP